MPILAQAAAFAEHHGFAIDVLAARRPTGKGRLARQVLIVREHAFARRAFGCLDEAFAGWLPLRRGLLHGTHVKVIGVRAEADHLALLPLPATAYRVSDRPLRSLGTTARSPSSPPATP